VPAGTELIREGETGREFFAIGEVALVQPERMIAARNRPAAGDLGVDGGDPFGVCTLARRLLPGAPAHLLLPPAAGRLLSARRTPLRRHQPCLLLKLGRDLRAGEVTGERRVRDPVIVSERP
jgi:hypothetical protein